MAKPKKPKLPKGWRKGLRYDKKEKRWRDVKTKRLMTERAIRFKVKYAEMQNELEKVKDKKKGTIENIKQALKAAANELKDLGYMTDTKIHPNKDGSVDAELRVKPKRGQIVNDVYLDMEEFLGPIPATFVSTGIRYHPRKDEEFYTKFQGMSQAQTYYQDMSPEKLHVNFMTGKVIDERMRKRGRKKAEQIFVRIHWNKDAERPETPLQRERQKGRK